MLSNVEKTLFEQMHISDLVIETRMRLLDIDLPRLSLLLKHKPTIENNVDYIVDLFYEKQTAVDEIALLIGDLDTLRRLRSAQRKYVMDLFCGFYDAEYVNNRLRIGMVHKRIGVDPPLYLSAVKTLKDIIFKVLKENIKNIDEWTLVVDTLDRLLYFDVSLIFDTYIASLVNEIESQKRKTEVYAKGLETKIAERTRELERLTKIDPLTDLYNQRAMREFLRRELLIAKRRQTKLTIVYFDVDEFKSINDSLGHAKGDEVLRKIGQCLLGSLRETDIACRYGGDEFCVILPDCNSDNGRVVCEKIINSFSSLYPDYSLSMGIVETGGPDYYDENKLLSLADDKMYLSKKVKGSAISS